MGCQRQVGCHECIGFLLMLEEKLDQALKIIEIGTEQEKKASLGSVKILIKAFNRGG